MGKEILRMKNKSERSIVTLTKMTSHNLDLVKKREQTMDFMKEKQVFYS